MPSDVVEREIEVLKKEIRTRALKYLNHEDKFVQLMAQIIVFQYKD